MRVGLLQLTSGDTPLANLDSTLALFDRAVGEGAEFVLTPEVTNCVSLSRAHQRSVLHNEDEDPTLDALRARAKAAGVHVLIGSLALKTDDPDGRFANRSILVGPDGAIIARYDKIHMFDVDVTPEETFRESESFRPGNRAVLAETPWGKLGMTVCYDLRFPHLFRCLAKAGAAFLSVPAAFSHVTGVAHWESLLRARAIENGAFVLAPAQTGLHSAKSGRGRRTHGHSLVISPWGEVLADGGTASGVVIVDLDPSDVTTARRRVPSLSHDRMFDGPE